jgi:lysophospholipase L1-like esterase
MHRLAVPFVLAPLLGAVFAGPAPASAGSTRVARVVVLGDSYSSGTGIHRDASDYDDQGPAEHSFSPRTRLGDSMCLRELDTTAGAQLAAALGATATMQACAGARIVDVDNQLSASRIAGDGTGTVVTITIGGNDVRTQDGGDWTDVLLDCVLRPGCHRDDGNQVVDLDDVGEALTDLYTSIGEDLPGLTVRVLAYPRPMQPDRWGCVGVTGIGTKEARWIDEQVDAVNAVVEAAVGIARARTSADVAFVPVTDEFDNHGSCRVWQRDRHINDAIWGETASRSITQDGSVEERHTDGVFTLSASSFHPSQKGYDAYARALVAAVTGRAPG